jgi:hypothetical protein
MKVDPKFWQAAVAIQLHMLYITVKSWKEAATNPATNCRRVKLPMNINYN